MMGLEGPKVARRNQAQKGAASHAKIHSVWGVGSEPQLHTRVAVHRSRLPLPQPRPSPKPERGQGLRWGQSQQQALLLRKLGQ